MTDSDFMATLDKDDADRRDRSKPADGIGPRPVRSDGEEFRDWDARVDAWNIQRRAVRRVESFEDIGPQTHFDGLMTLADGTVVRVSQDGYSWSIHGDISSTGYRSMAYDMSDSKHGEARSDHMRRLIEEQRTILLAEQAKAKRGKKSDYRHPETSPPVAPLRYDSDGPSRVDGHTARLYPDRVSVGDSLWDSGTPRYPLSKPGQHWTVIRVDAETATLRNGMTEGSFAVRLADIEGSGVEAQSRPEPACTDPRPERPATVKRASLFDGVVDTFKTETELNGWKPRQGVLL